MSYQFIHFDSYAREGSKQSKTVTKKNGDKITTTKQVKSIRQILEEQARIEEACPHIDHPRRPGLLYGVHRWRFSQWWKTGQIMPKMPKAEN